MKKKQFRISDGLQGDPFRLRNNTDVPDNNAID